MLASVTDLSLMPAIVDVIEWLNNTTAFLKVLIGFSLIVFVHELGHFLFAKWSNVKVERFAVGFGPRLFGWRKGQGFTFGASPALKAEELRERNWGETDYCFNALPFGGYVKMLGEDDIIIDEKTGDVSLTDDPRAFNNRPVGQRMIITSAGVVFNLIFAAVLYMAIFLIGYPMEAPELGLLPADSPAAKAGLQAGDRIVAINGNEVKSFRDVRFAEILNEELSVVVQRDGQRLPEPIHLNTIVEPRRNLRTAGFVPASSMRLGGNADPVDDLPAPKKGDLVTRVDGQRVGGIAEAILLVADRYGEVVSLQVERPNPDKPAASPQELEVFQKVDIFVQGDPYVDRAQEDAAPNTSILGMHRRTRVVEALEGGPAEAAGLKAGDVILQFGTVANPTWNEIRRATKRNANQPVTVVVERPDAAEPVSLTVTPRTAFSLFSETPAFIQAHLRPENDEPVVAKVEADTPAAELQLPRGARLVQVAGAPVASWGDVLQQLTGHAGATVEVVYAVLDEEFTASLAIPSSVVNETDLRPDAFITKIAGAKEIALEDGTTARLPSPAAATALFEQHIGETVTVEYSYWSGDELTTASTEFTVRAENIVPWQLYVRGVLALPIAGLKTEIVDADGNPLKAVWMGVEGTVFKVYLTYKSLQLLLSGGASVRDVRGPVGIVSTAMEEAKTGLLDLLFFLAFISINLAVINFLPIPVVDGGVMMFLLLEKVRGKPLSLKVQMITTMVGLALILTVAVLVTFQDVMRLITGEA